MPPARALVTSQPFSDDFHPVHNLTYPILSLSFVFISGLFLTFRSIIRRRRPIHDNAHPCTTAGSPTFLSNDKKRASFAPTVSTLAAQSTIVASSPLRLDLIPELGPPSTLSRGRATIEPFSLGLSTRVFSRFSSLRPQPTSSNGKEYVEPRQHLSDLKGPQEDTDDPKLDIRVPDTINILQTLQSINSVHSTDDFKAETHVIPFIILSLPSSEDLVEDPPLPVSLDEDLLSPDGTFRPAGFPALVAVDTHDPDNAIRPVLASRLRERRKRPMSWPSANVLATPGMAYWPRWF